MRTDTLHVVTHRRWVADDLSPGAPADLVVRHHFGFDLPSFAPGDALWAPMEWVARAVRQDPRLRLVDPGAGFLTRLPEAVTGRRVELLTVADMDARVPAKITDDGPLVFAKPANCKIEAFPAHWDDYDGHALRACMADIPADQPFLITETRLDLVEEHRLWVLDGEIVTSSPYLQHDRNGTDTTWHPAMSTTREDADTAEMFGHRVLTELTEAGADLPRAFTLDVGFLTDGRLVVIEANPAWSSALYGARPDRVVECLRAAVTIVDDPDAPPVQHQWTPDPYLTARVDQQRPLGSTSTPNPHTAQA